MESYIIVYSIIFVLIPVAIAGNRRQPNWAILLNLLVSVLIVPVLFLWVLAGAAFGSLEGLLMAIIFLFLPYSLAFIIEGKKEIENRDDLQDS